MSFDPFSLADIVESVILRECPRPNHTSADGRVLPQDHPRREVAAARRVSDPETSHRRRRWARPR
jgi:hypothetical protein